MAIENATFIAFRESGKYYGSSRGYLSEAVFKVHGVEERLAQILKDNDGKFPGLSGPGTNFVRVILGDPQLAYEIPLMIPAGVV